MNALPLLAALLVLAPDLQVPVIGGHMTDPGRKLSPAAKTSVEDALGKLADDTHVDVAGWVSDLPEAQADAYGAAFYKRWNIGGEWDSGVFFMMPSTGPVHVILEPGHPKLTPQEVARLVAADRPGADMETRLNALAAAVRPILLPKAIRVRPWGEKRPARALGYAAMAAVVAFAAAAQALRRRARDPSPRQG